VSRSSTWHAITSVLRQVGPRPSSPPFTSPTLAIVVAALGCAAGVYNVVDDRPVTKHDYAQACSDAVGVESWVRMPGRLGLLLGDRLTSVTRSLRVSNSRFTAATGRRPKYPSVWEGYLAMAAGG
jgi:nucleoside-diphosphate-sugar epimerase